MRSVQCFGTVVQAFGPAANSPSRRSPRDPFLNQLPTLLGGDPDEAARLVQQARALEPEVGNRIAEARALLAARDR